MPGAIRSDSLPALARMAWEPPAHAMRSDARPAAATTWRANGLAIDVRAAGDVSSPPVTLAIFGYFSLVAMSGSDVTT